MKEILFQFGLAADNFTAQPFGSGLINATWVVDSKKQSEKYILQKINRQIFKQPQDIAFNIRLIDHYLNKNFPDYLFVAPCKTVDGDELVKNENEYFRLFPFVAGSHTIDVVEKPQQAFEAAKQFGQFTKLLAGFGAEGLKTTLTDFHDLTLRYRQFENALLSGNAERIEQSADLISFIEKHKTIVERFEKVKYGMKLRCTHHDTKISNVLFDNDDKGLCVIDLDTIMPGYFISDLGDMMRTYLCPVSEEERDFSKILVREEFYKAIIDGYNSEMAAELSAIEKEQFHFSGQFMIYMQALRFLTDHINDDKYYGAKYEDHNFVRAGNQITLLQRYLEINQH